MKKDIASGPDSIPAKVTKSRAKAKAATVVVQAVVASEVAVTKEAKPKARAKAVVKVADTQPSKIVQDTASEVTKTPALVPGDIESQSDGKHIVELTSAVQFTKLQRGQEQDVPALAKAIEAEKLATVNPMTREQSLTTARAQQVAEKKEVENSIEVGPMREIENIRRVNIGKQMPEIFKGQLPSPAILSDPVIDRTKAVPDAVRANYLRVENEYFHMDKKPAFVDHGTKLTTKGENTEVIHSLVSIAQARSWGSVTVKGTDNFRRAAWHEASLNGLEVAGYTPSKVEEAHLAAAREAKAQKLPDNSIEQGRVINLAKAPETAIQAANKNMRDAEKKAPAAPSVASDAPAFAQPKGIVGKLLDHGKAPYMYDEKKDNSYFVTVETGVGKKTVWGVDLSRAIAEAKVKIGETISVEKQGSKDVVAQERVFDANGKEIGRRPVETYKNKWFVGSLDKAMAFAQGKREEVIQAHPDLAGAYGTVAAATAFAKQHFPDHEDRFVAIGKQTIAANIAAGKETPAVQIRETQIKVVDRTKQEDQERT